MFTYLEELPPYFPLPVLRGRVREGVYSRTFNSAPTPALPRITGRGSEWDVC